VHGLGILLIILVRVILSADAGSNSVFSRPWIVSLAVRAALIFAAFSTLIARSPVWTVVCLVVAFPLIVVRLVLAPLGIPNAVFHFTRFLRPHSIAEEAVGGATYHELRARLRHGTRLGGEATRPLAKELSNQFDAANDRKVRGTTLAARGILDALDGSWQSARELFDVVQDMRPRHAPRAARVYSQSFLLADAARRGAYHELVRLAARGPVTFRRAFLRACALRMLGRPDAPRDLVLKLLWLTVPARRATLPLLKSALLARPRAPIVLPGGDLASVTRATVLLLRLPRGTATRGELFAIARAWQALLEGDELRARVATRRDELEATFDGGAVTAALEAGLTTLLAELLCSTPSDASETVDEPLLVIVAKDGLQSELLAELEELAADLPTDGDKRFEGYDHHWRTWARLRAVTCRYLDALPERREHIYHAIGATLLNHGAWLHNTEEGKLVAHDVFRFLLKLAPRGAEDYETLKKNAAIGRSL
jgi:hypothetical protein